MNKPVKKDTVQGEFQKGYMGGKDQKNPHIWSSTYWEAYELGKFLSTSGYYPLIKKSRGSSFKTFGFIYKIKYDKKGEITILKEVNI